MVADRLPCSMTTLEGFDRIADALSARERRRILVDLLAEDPLDYDEAVRAIEAGDRDGTSPGDGGGLQAVETDRTAIRMTHIHLPKLREHGYVDWTPDADAIERGPQFGEVGPVVRLIAEHRDDLPTEWP